MQEANPKRADVYLRRGQLFVQSLSLTTAGMYVTWEPVFALGERPAQDELGAKIVMALDGTRFHVPHPRSSRDGDQLIRPLFQLAGVKSWGAFSRSAEKIKVEEHHDLALISMRTADGGGYVRGPLIVHTTRDDLARLGEQVIELFERQRSDEAQR